MHQMMPAQQHQHQACPRTAGLGLLAALPDEVLDSVFKHLDAQTLLRLTATSKLLRVYASEEPVWMHICLDEHSDKLCWQGSWKRTALFHSSPSGAAAQGPVCPLPVAAPVGFHSLFLYRRWYRCHLDVRGFWPPQQQVPRVSGADLSLEQFTAEYDQRSSPVMLTGLTQGWKASAWDVQSLVAEYRDVCFQASKPAGGNVPMTLRDYMAYAVAQQDEEPLYVFDKGFGEAAPVMLQAYEVPKVFPEDLFAGLGYKRPSFRWLVAGPPRSGAAWHVDPTLTSAWNALLAGRKRWALYPPHRIPPGINFHVDEEGEVDFDTPSSLRWFLEVYPELTEGQRPLEILQEPGEVIFVPGGWWHCVLNLDHSIALTQNAISAASLAGAVEFMACGAAPHFFLRAPHWNAAHPAKAAKASGLGSTAQHGQQAQRGQGHRGGLPTGSAGPQADAGEGAPAKRLVPGSRVVSDEGDGYSALSSLPADMLPKVTGFRRSKLVGPWLHDLWAQKPELQGTIWRAAQQHLAVEHWQRRLGRVCTAHGLPGPSQQQCLPVGGGESLVFALDGLVVKFYANPDYTVALFMWEVERSLYQTIAQHPVPLQAITPRLVASGICSDERQLNAASSLSEAVRIASERHPAAIQAASCNGTATAHVPNQSSPNHQEDCQPHHVPPDQTRAADPAAAMLLASEAEGGSWPYIVTTSIDGISLRALEGQATADEWLHIAHALGQAVSHLHRLPLPVKQREGPLARPELVQMTSWQGLTSAELEPCITSRRDDHSLAAEHPSSSSNGVAGSSHTSHAAGCMPTSGQHDDVKHVPATSPTPPTSRWPAALSSVPPAWRPFVAFLQRQRHRLVCEGAMDGLPPLLRQQLGSYLPRDCATLVSRPAENSCHSSPAAAAKAGPSRAGSTDRGFVSDGCHMPAGSNGEVPPAGSLAAAARAAHPDTCSCAWMAPEPNHHAGRKHPDAQTPQPPSPASSNADHDPSGCSVVPDGVRMSDPSTDTAAGASGGRFLPPVWLHGDLTPENVLLAGPLASLDGRAGNLRLLDFADGGHGDALYDLVALFISTLQCVPARLKAFLEAYGGVPDLAEQGSGEHVAAENGPVQAPDAQMLARGGDGAGQGGDGCRGTVDADGQPVARQGAVAGRKQAAAQRTQALAVEADAGKEVAWRRPGTSSLAYRCMVYTLLHDQDMFARVLEKQPQLAMLDSWQAVAESLWGQVGFALA